MDSLYELALSIKALDRELARRVNDLMRPLGLTAAQADALTVIGQAEPLSLKELGELLIAEAGHPSRLVDRLVDGGFVERRPAEDDRRRIVLSLTPPGRKLVKRIEADRAQFLDLMREVLGNPDLTEPLRLARQWLAFSPYGELIERRKRLMGD